MVGTAGGVGTAAARQFAIPSFFFSDSFTLCRGIFIALVPVMLYTDARPLFFTMAVALCNWKGKSQDEFIERQEIEIPHL